jgi:hypothetical protein
LLDLSEARSASDLRAGGEVHAHLRRGRSDRLPIQKIVHHLFCHTCGVGSFAKGRAPDGTEMVAVNVRCLDDVDLGQLTPTPFDGKNL